MPGSTSPRNGAEFPVEETHGIALWPQHRLVVHSRGLGWHDVYTSLAAERSWSNTLRALPHTCLAYCHNRSAAVRRVIPGDGLRTEAILRPRQLGVVPADRDSRWVLHGSPDIQLVYLRRGMVERVAAEAFGGDPAKLELVPGLGFHDALAEQLFLALLGALRAGPDSADGLYADSIAHLLALHLLRQHSVRSMPPAAAPASCGPARIRHVLDFIEAKLDEDLSLARLAAEAGIGSHAFSAAFTRAVGVTPHRYVVQRRIERAKHLLRNSDQPVVETALQAGFASQSHLTAAFKRATGMTPRAYRKGGG